MKYYLCFLLICPTYLLWPIPPVYYRSFTPTILLESLAEKTDWPEIPIEHGYNYIEHISFSLDNKYIVLSDGNNTQHIKIKRILNATENEPYTNQIWTYLKSWFLSEPIQVATQPENQVPQNEFLKKCFSVYKRKELIEKIICLLNGNLFLIKEKTNQLEKPSLKLIDVRDFAQFAQEIVHDHKYKSLLYNIEYYYLDKKQWHIENDSISSNLFSELPELVKEHLGNLVSQSLS